MSRFVISVYFLLFALATYGQQVTLAPGKQTLLLGEQMEVKKEAVVTIGTLPGFFYTDTLPHFEVLQRGKIDSVVNGSKILLSQTILVTSWDSGRWNFPVLMVDGRIEKTVPVIVTYTTPWNPDQPYHDIKGISPVEPGGKSSWWWYLIGLAVLTALFMLFFPGDKKQPPSELDKNAYKRAMQELGVLEQNKTAQDTEFFTELVAIFRTYLKGSKGIHSFSKTTDDLVIQLQPLKLHADDYTRLVQTLRLSDLVKFARYRPGAEAKVGSVNSIRQSITLIEQQHAV